MKIRLFIQESVRQRLMENRIKYSIDIPSDIIGIKDLFKQHRYKLYVVGGAVRDALLNQKPKDFDLATDALPDKVEEILNGAGYRTIPTGKAFGVINVFTDRDEYEIATFRTETYSDTDKRRPDSVSFSDIKFDSKRRDLTINALYYDIDTQEVVDLVGGVDDLKNGVVRTVGNPSDRFNEDRLRILRAIRFAGRFGSELDPVTDKALRLDSSLEGISGERIRDEFIKGIQTSKSTVHYLSIIDRYNLFQWIFKGLNVENKFIEDKDPMLVIATLLRKNNPQAIGKVLNSLKYSVDEIKSLRFLIQLLLLVPENAVQMKRNQQNAGLTDEQIRKFGASEGMNQKLLGAFIRFRLTVDGNEVMQQYNLPQGKELGDTINHLEYENFKKLF
jgi:tRNA nucleotidyltransferase/poly(A) polymerase